jgi:hypothetical protein
MVRLHGGSHNVRALARDADIGLWGWLVGANGFTYCWFQGLPLLPILDRLSGSGYWVMFLANDCDALE